MQYQIRNLNVTQDNVSLTRVKADVVLVHDDASEKVIATQHEMTLETTTVAEMVAAVQIALLDVARLHWQEHNQVPAMVDALTDASWTPPASV